MQERAAAKRKQSATKQSPSHLAALASSQDELGNQFPIFVDRFSDSSLSDAGPGNVAESQDLQVETSAPDSPTPPSRTGIRPPLVLLIIVDSPVDTKDVQISQLTTKLAGTLQFLFCEKKLILPRNHSGVTRIKRQIPKI